MNIAAIRLALATLFGFRCGAVRLDRALHLFDRVDAELAQAIDTLNAEKNERIRKMNELYLRAADLKASNDIAVEEIVRARRVRDRILSLTA
jgi:hypothetical protein